MGIKTSILSDEKPHYVNNVVRFFIVNRKELAMKRLAVALTLSLLASTGSVKAYEFKLGATTPQTKIVKVRGCREGYSDCRLLCDAKYSTFSKRWDRCLRRCDRKYCE